MIKTLLRDPEFPEPLRDYLLREAAEGGAEILSGTRTIVVEDDAYGELQFSGVSRPPFKKYLPDQTILTGSFSKILAPGMRLGWVCAPAAVMDQLVIAKQASDLHSNYLSQRIASRLSFRG